MNIAVYSAHKFEQGFLVTANAEKHGLHFIETRLTDATVPLSAGCECACIFTEDHATADVLQALHKSGVRYLALRSAGFNHVALDEARKLGIKVARVPAYSSHAIAEHAVALIMALNRRLIRAHSRVMDCNFSLDGLTGFDMWGKTVGIVGTGKIGCALARIMYGFGCRILAHDVREEGSLKEKFGVVYTDLDTLLRESHIISLHVPLNEETKHLISRERIEGMKRGVMLINTGRGGLVCAKDVIDALKSGHIGYFGMDVYEEEDGLFFEDHSGDILQDDVIARLMTFPNVLITSHQAFLTDTALRNIADTTIQNIDSFEQGSSNGNFLVG